jgi:hypothetical protein
LKLRVSERFCGGRRGSPVGFDRCTKQWTEYRATDDMMTVNASRKELRCRSFAPDDRFHRQRRKELEVEGLTAALGERSTSAMAIATGHGKHAPAVELRQAA